HDRERRRGHLGRVRAELRGDGTDEERLPSAEITDQVNDGIGRQRARDLAPGGGGVRLIATEIRPRHPGIVGWRYTPLTTVDGAAGCRKRWRRHSPCFSGISMR